ncbi:PREDICTED: neprilysin-1 [Ceratosolen solmsi marchali]|uniref:Neprilysin-1 n=1 Tax=Ceratosolen solmsi marchali TaxID=326594 RepID=A0AAJ6YJH6_9HYME|nr:PREDICTED: neprilysin-1 [Ceratosolen solmsi marchali]
MNNNKQSVDSQAAYFINSENNIIAIKSKRSFFKKYRKKEPIIFILTFIITVLSVAIVVFAALYAKFNQRINYCENENCLRIAASLKESMDTSIDPCDDFYKYACGRWPTSHPSLDPSQEYSWFKERSMRVSTKIRDLLLKNLTNEDFPSAIYEAKTLFVSCINIETRNELGLSPLFDLLNELDLPQIPATITKNTTNFIVQMAKVKRVLWADIFFGTYISNDPKDNRKNVIVLDLPDRANPFPSDKILEKRLQIIKTKTRLIMEEVDEINEEIKAFLSAEKIYMTEVFKQVISNGTTDQRSCKSRKPFSIISEEDIQNTVNEVYKLSEVFYTLSNLHRNQTMDDDNDIQDSDYMLIEDLQQITDEYVKSINESLEPKIIWKPFIQELLKEIIDFDPKEKILISDINYLKEVAVILSSTGDNLLETAIWWTVVDYSVPYSSENLRRIWDTYTLELTGAKLDHSWPIICAENVNDLMGMAVSWLYVNPSFTSDGSIDQVSEMLENIKLSFSKFVLGVDWMDDQTKIKTLEKNRKMKSLIGFPKWLFQTGELDIFYKGINMSDGYFENMLQIIRIQNLNQLRYLANNETDDEPYWPLEPTEVNAVHTFQENQIAIPAGILQFPFYELGLESLNYGALGTILGHELTHGFDNSGRRFDSTGNLKEWWSNETISQYTDKTTCFVDQYSKYFIPEVNKYIDGQLTLDENIADNGGLREAYHAYQIWKTKHKKESLLPGFTHLTHDQLLFLSYAHMWCESFTYHDLKWMLQDPHCPGNIRLKMVLRNSKHFSKAWNCPIGSNMNPIKKCQLW